MTYHYSFEINWVLGVCIVRYNCFSELRDVMAGIALSGEINFSVLVSGESIKPSDYEVQ
jgi:hypothetical protein